MIDIFNRINKLFRVYQKENKILTDFLERNEKMGVVEMTEKQNYIVQLLDKNINMPTKDIIADYNKLFNYDQK